ncbi:hypothetical protein DFJ74DRAFT_696798 [Hyaloraphidium curvatum]|nr:hypothetical protein DFJ74DRAFT_696798 [Hyaloraphidium curvatum]
MTESIPGAAEPTGGPAANGGTPAPESSLPPLDRPVAKLPDFPPFTPENVPPGIAYDLLKEICEDYRLHCQVLLDCVQRLRFSEMEQQLRHFWQNMSPAHREVVEHVEVADWIWKFDAVLYDTILALLLPNVVQVLPVQVCQTVRQYTRHAEGWLLQALDGFSPYLKSRKIEVGKVYIQQLRRNTSLNQLAQAASQVFDATDQVHQMLLDWNRTDFEGIREQVAWVTDCRRVDVGQIMEIDIRQMLQPGVKLEHWTIWLEEVVNRFLDQKTADHQRYVYAARQFLMRWNYYGTLVLRDLTMRSAPSFGAVHLVYLFLNEYVFYLVEQRVANLKSLELLK